MMQTITLHEIEHGGLCPPQMLTEQTGCLVLFWLIEFSMEGGKKRLVLPKIILRIFTCRIQAHGEQLCIAVYVCQKVTSLHDNGGEKTPNKNTKQTQLSLCHLCSTCVYTYFGLIIKFSGLSQCKFWLQLCERLLVDGKNVFAQIKFYFK